MPHDTDLLEELTALVFIKYFCICGKVSQIYTLIITSCSDPLLYTTFIIFSLSGISQELRTIAISVNNTEYRICRFVNDYRKQISTFLPPIMPSLVQGKGKVLPRTGHESPEGE